MVAADGSGALAPFARPDQVPNEQVGAAWVIGGWESSRRLGDIVRLYGERGLLITYGQQDKLASAAVRDRISRCRETTEVVIGEVAGQLDVETVASLTALALEHGADWVVGLGGGGPLDAAKAVAMMATNGGSVRDYHAGRQVTKRPLPWIAVPTSVGTGSEATKVAVVADRSRQIIKSFGHGSMAAPVAFIDPALAITLPVGLAAIASFDAISHCLEAYVSRNASPLSDAHALLGLQSLASGLRRMLERDLTGQLDAATAEDLMLGSHFGGLALSASPGLAHVLAQPVSAVSGISHAAAIAVLLPYAVAFNAHVCTTKYRQAAAVLELALPKDRRPAHPVALETILRELERSLGVPGNFAALKVDPPDVAAVMRSVTLSTGHIWTNPRDLDPGLVEGVLRAAIVGGRA
jgi:alcohol dehydrogenase class IV